MMGSHPGPLGLQKHYGRPRLRWLVEEADELPVRVLVQLRERGRPSPVFPVSDRIRFVAGADGIAAPRVRPEAVHHLLCGRPSPTPRLYVRCPRCDARRLSLFLVWGVLGCRGCLGLRYLSQGKGQWNGDVIRAVERRMTALRSRPGPKGRRYRAWARRAVRADHDVPAARRAVPVREACPVGRPPGYAPAVRPTRQAGSQRLLTSPAEPA